MEGQRERASQALCFFPSAGPTRDPAQSWTLEAVYPAKVSPGQRGLLCCLFTCIH